MSWELGFRGRRGAFAAGFCYSFFDSRLNFNFTEIHHGRKLGNQKESRSIQHALFTKRQGFHPAEMNKILEHFGDMKDRTRPHSFGVFLESVLPIALCEEFIVSEIIDQLIDVFAVDDLPESDVACVHGRYHHEDVVGTNSQEIESFKLTRDQTIGNLLNYSNPMIRVNDLVANLKLVHMT